MKIVFEVSAGAVHNLGIASAISNQHVATNLCIPIEQILLSTFPLSQQWFHANMCKRKKKALKNIYSPRGFREDTTTQNSWPITTLSNHGPAETKCLSGPCAGVRIYRTATKYMRIIYP